MPVMRDFLFSLLPPPFQLHPSNKDGLLAVSLVHQASSTHWCRASQTVVHEPSTAAEPEQETHSWSLESD